MKWVFIECKEFLTRKKPDAYTLPRLPSPSCRKSKKQKLKLKPKIYALILFVLAVPEDKALTLPTQLCALCMYQLIRWFNAKMNVLKPLIAKKPWLCLDRAFM